jgi:hypothetical protein
MSVTLSTGYILDANFLIDIGRRIYPPESRQAARRVVEELIERGLITSPREVYLELKAKTKGEGDETLNWCDSHKDIFNELDEPQQAHLADVLRRFPALLKHDAEGPDADPSLIAMALDSGWTVVSRDGAGAGANVVRVHQVCAELSLSCLTEHEFLKQSGWTG